MMNKVLLCLFIFVILLICVHWNYKSLSRQNELEQLEKRRIEEQKMQLEKLEFKRLKLEKQEQETPVLYPARSKEKEIHFKKIIEHHYNKLSHYSGL